MDPYLSDNGCPESVLTKAKAETLSYIMNDT